MSKIKDKFGSHFFKASHARAACIAFGLLFLIACAQKMGHPPEYRPLQPSAFFRDGQSARPTVPGTVPSKFTKDKLRAARFFEEPAFDPNAQTLPFPLTKDVLKRGQERYQIYCAECHGALGDGDGMIVRRGFSRPPSYHDERLRQAPLGHFYDVMTNGYGAMASYAVQVEPPDRWAIAAYIRALQLSQHATMNDVPTDKRAQLEQGGAR